jgi:Wadjet anti plasmid transformation system JetA-like protein
VKTSSTSAHITILSRLLEAHERSSSFGSPGPWKRDVILRFDARTFPSAFAPDGREEREGLVTAARDLEGARALRVVRHKGFADGELRELRLGAAELDAAYDAARVVGFVPLRDAVKQIGEHACTLATRTNTPWARSFLSAAGAGVAKGQLRWLGISAERAKRERRDVCDALTCLSAIADGANGWERMVSEEIFGQSKRLGSIRSLVGALLARADPRWEGVSLDPDRDVFDLLGAYGIRRRPGLLRCAGAASLLINGRTYSLRDFEPTAHLPEGWSQALVSGIAASGITLITTIENEYPFIAYVEEAGGPTGLGARGELAVFVSGFPTPAIVEFLVGVVRQSPAVLFRHWGDADVGGIRIWLLLREALGCPIALYRTTGDWVEREANSGRTTALLSKDELRTLNSLRARVRALDADDVLVLIDALQKHGIKIEQERV